MKELAGTLIPATGFHGRQGRRRREAPAAGSSLAARLDAMYEVVTKYLPGWQTVRWYWIPGCWSEELSDGLNRELGKAYS